MSNPGRKKVSLPSFKDMFSDIVPVRSSSAPEQSAAGRMTRQEGGTGRDQFFPEMTSSVHPFISCPPQLSSARSAGGDRQSSELSNGISSHPIPQGQPYSYSQTSRPATQGTNYPRANGSPPVTRIRRDDDRASRTHTEDKRYMCQVCGKLFSRPSAVEAHMPSHTGERPYPCTYAGCTKSFTTKSNMRRHYQTHTATEPERSTIFP